LLCISLKHFNKKKIELAHEKSNKTYNCSKALRKTTHNKAPKESNYVVELYSIIRDWLPYPNIILSEVNSRNKYADLHILQYIDDKMVGGTVLELVSNERHGSRSDKGSVAEHVDRGEFYHTTLGSETWVLHFISVEIFPDINSKNLVEWELSNSVNSVYVYHDYYFQNVKLFILQAGNSNPTETIVFGATFPKF